jgi:hypothetical protein
MTHKFHLLKGIAVLVFAAATFTSVTASAGAVVYVANVEQLYAAVNNIENVGATVVLAPRIYSLSVNNPAGAPRPNGGRLELQRDMSLYGVAGDRAAVVIEASGLLSSSFTVGVSFGRTGVIRTGRGSNAVEWLTIAGHKNAAAAVETDLFERCGDPEKPSPCPTHIRVAHVVGDVSARGVDVRNVTGDMRGRRIDAEIVDNEFFHGVEGIRVINFMGADEGDISVVMSGNRSYQNIWGCIFENNRSSFARIYVRSSGDRFEDNWLGCQIGGGFVLTATGAANYNSVEFEAHGTHFINNTSTTIYNDTGQIGGFGGVLAVGGDGLGHPHSTSGNTVTVRLWGCRVAENSNPLRDPPGIDFQAFGARSSDPLEVAGNDNHVTIELHGVSKEIDVVKEDSVPVDLSGSNTVTVIRSPDAP